MNSSPPPPSFTLPPLTSRGQLPVTPSPTPTPNEDGTFDFHDKSRRDKGKFKAREAHDIDEIAGRISMYVRLFEGELPKVFVLKCRNDTDGSEFRVVSIFSAGEMGFGAYHRS